MVSDEKINATVDKESRNIEDRIKNAINADENFKRILVTKISATLSDVVQKQSQLLANAKLVADGKYRIQLKIKELAEHKTRLLESQKALAEIS